MRKCRVREGGLAGGQGGGGHSAHGLINHQGWGAGRGEGRAAARQGAASYLALQPC